MLGSGDLLKMEVNPQLDTTGGNFSCLQPHSESAVLFALLIPGNSVFFFFFGVPDRLKFISQCCKPILFSNDS